MAELLERRREALRVEISDFNDRNRLQLFRIELTGEVSKICV